MDNESGDNIVRLHGVTCHYQEALDRQRVLATPDYTGGLAAVVDVFGVGGIPNRVDLAFDFDEPRAGFAGLIVEAKSGKQLYQDAVTQLRTYRAARARQPGSRYLIWGIVEGAHDPAVTRDQVKRALAATAEPDDVWLFSGADAIGDVLSVVFGDS
jgi:hypothetical protein